MKLYAEIFLLQGYFKGKYCVENVISWHEPLLKPQEVEKHYYWANFFIPPTQKTGFRGHACSVETLQKIKGADLSSYTGVDKKLLLRNCVEPQMGKYILDRVKVEDKKIVEIVEQQNLF